MSLLSGGTPGITALLAHVPGLIIGMLMFSAGASVMASALAVGTVAALLAWYWQQPFWWRVINLGFVPLLVMMTSWQGDTGIDSRWFLLAFMLLALTSWGTIRTRVPLFLSSRQACSVLAEKLPANGTLVDIGCGLGSALAHMARVRPDARLRGVETAPLTWLFASLRFLGKRRSGQVQIRLGSLWEEDLSDCDIVYAYLSPAPMARLWHKVSREMKAGSLFISNTFAVPDTPPHETVELHDLTHARLLVWRI